MLSRAVQVHAANAPPPKPAKPLAQQLFPSSSPVAVQDYLDSPSRGRLSTGNVSKLSAFGHVNGTYGNQNHLKRSASETFGMGSYTSRPHKATSETRQSIVYGSTMESAIDLTQPSSMPCGSAVGKLHESVVFDENDFVDDADLNLDEDDISTVKPLPTPVVYPTLPPESSVPIPWSSSPPRHQLAPLDANTPHEALARQTKRRKLPWKEEAEEEPDVQITSYGKSNAKEANTPLSKDKLTGSPYPWNKTASAMKEEQRKHRQQVADSKKHLQTTDGNKDTIDSGLSVKTSKTKNPNGVAKFFLSKEQRRILDLVVSEGQSVFFTGSAGTGKSVLMREIISALRRKFAKEPDRVAVTASTGLAACNVGGVTLHSFAGIGLGKEDVPTLVKKIKRSQKAKLRWQRTKVLVVDEISMVHGELFDKLESVARSIRANARPFGGLQLVITGDFFQLPPVPDSSANGVAKFAFDAATWNTSINHTIGLTQVFRQKDPVFANMLNEMRLGKLTKESIEAFHKLNRPLPQKDEIEATELFPTRNEVEQANNMRMRSLGGSPVVFEAEDSGSIQDIAQRQRLLFNCIAPAKLTLKKGAQVMLIKNIDETLVNGSLGKVIGFMSEKTFDYYHEHEDQFQPEGTQTLDEEAIALGKLNHKEFDEPAGSTLRTWPLVRFLLPDGSSRELLCQRESWKIELPNGEIQAQRSQIPLILSWAISIHKAQGQTLPRVKVDLGKIFEKGQAYVALSRATCQEGLQISRFDPRKVMAHDKVRTFYDSLYNVGSLSKPADQGDNTVYRDEDSAFEDDEDALAQTYG